MSITSIYKAKCSLHNSLIVTKKICLRLQKYLCVPWCSKPCRMNGECYLNHKESAVLSKLFATFKQFKIGPW